MARTRATTLLFLLLLFLLYWKHTLLFHNSGNLSPFSDLHAHTHARIHTYNQGMGGGEGTWLPHLCPRPPGYWDGPLHAPDRLRWMSLRQDAIFFLQTSCSASFTAREACAVESAARHHPRRPIQVLLTAPTLNLTHPLLQVVQGVGNVHLSWLDLDQVFSAAPLSTWHLSRQWLGTATGYNKAVMVSDAVRLELLRQYGGTYLDIDSITVAPLPSRYSFVARFSDSLISNGVMSFSRGHKLLKKMVEDIPAKWNPASYISIGADLLTHHLHLHCPHNLTAPPLMPPPHQETCGDVQVYPGQLFFPFSNGTDLKQIFHEGKSYGQAFVRSFRGYSLHLYNHLTYLAHVDPLGESVAGEVAVRHCPAVVRVLVQHGAYL